MTECYLHHEEHIPERAKFPVIDAHNHLWGNWAAAADVVAVMDAVGVEAYCDLTANIRVHWGDGGYKLGAGSFADFLANCEAPYPGRFYGFTCATFAAPTDRPLVEDWDRFVPATIAMLRDHVAQGARGLKLLKELGLHYRDAAGRLIHFDDERLGPIWEACADLGVPILVHQSDPYGFFQPITPANEHYDSLQKYPDWSFADPRFPRKEELLERRDRVVARHPRTTFLLPHVANFAENLAYVSDLLEAHPNVCIDLSARLDELGRQPYSAREFCLRWQDRIYFGTDMPASVDMYRFYFRFFETFDEAFIPPDYDGTFDRWRWRICGIGLPNEVLKKLYYQNALRLIPGLREQFDRRRANREETSA